MTVLLVVSHGWRRAAQVKEVNLTVQKVVQDSSRPSLHTPLFWLLRIQYCPLAKVQPGVDIDEKNLLAKGAASVDVGCDLECRAVLGGERGTGQFVDGSMPEGPKLLRQMVARPTLKDR